MNLQQIWIQEDVNRAFIEMTSDMTTVYSEEMKYLSNHETVEGDMVAVTNTAAHLEFYSWDELLFHYNDFKKYIKSEAQNSLEDNCAVELYAYELKYRASNNILLKLLLPIELLF